MRIAWSPRAVATAARFMKDQEGMREIGAAINALAQDPYPPESFSWGSYRRLRVGPYRVMYAVEAGLITIDRVDRVTAS
ncbi:MAG: type II toxin-antitoxin system RelE/ParE family toxin [Streptosporangiaceae bacterium]